MFGMPLSLLGLVMYVVLSIAGFWHLRQKDESQVLGALFIYALSLAGIIFTGYLYYLEIFVIHAFCAWCIGSSILIASILVLSVLNLTTTDKYLDNAIPLLRVRIKRYVKC